MSLPVLSNIILRPRFIILLGAIVSAIGYFGLWGAVQYSLYGISVEGKVIEFHYARTRSNSVIATVEVVMPDAAPFQWEVDDWLNMHDWVDGGAVPLLCGHMHADHISCLLDSTLEIYLQPLILLALGAGLAAFGVKRARV